MSSRLLFILKCREGNWGYGSRESGLSNSARFVVDMLQKNGIEAKAVEVIDNNCIDREVTLYSPTHVIIEAFWVVPEKFDVLMSLHPKVRWIVRDHSETPFLANEGIAFGWTLEYLKRGVEVMCNSPRAVGDMAALAITGNLNPENVTYGPNVYPTPGYGEFELKKRNPARIDVGCFGAIRPLKSHMTQVIAALIFAKSVGAKLNFHINATRVEGKGDPILKNIRETFARLDHNLVEHGWCNHKEFLNVLKGMDISLQVSFTETFNIVAADSMASGVPLVVSNEVPWIGEYAHRHPTDTFDISKGMWDIWYENDKKRIRRLERQRRDMERYVTKSTNVWVSRFK